MDFISFDTTTLIVIASVVLPLLFLIPVFKMVRGFTKGAKESARILNEGRSAKAKIMQLQPTGTMINNQPLSVVTLEVEDGASKYQVTSQMVIHQLFIPQIQPGKIVPVKIDLQDKNKVVIDMNQLSSVQN